MKRLLSLALLALLLAAAPASAYEYEPLTYDGFIDGSDAVGVGSPSFNNLVKVGFDQATETVYGTTNEGQGRVYKFDAATRESEPFSELAPNSVFTQFAPGGGGFAVDNSGTATQGLIYAFPQFGPVSVYLPGGAKKTDIDYLPQGTICGAAVDPDGHLWLASLGLGIKEYGPSGLATGKTIVPDPGPHENRPETCEFAIDSQYNFYLPESYNNSGYVKKYDSNGAFQYRLGAGFANYVTVDRRDDSVYVVDRAVPAVEKYSSTGSLLDEFGQAEASGAPCPTVVEEAGECYDGISDSAGIAVDESTGDVYLANRGFPERIDIFSPSGPPTTLAGVDTDLPVPTPTSALLRGTLDPDGVATTDCKFEWGAGSGFEGEVPCNEGVVLSGSGDQHVSGEITGLSLGNTYHFRLVVENANGVSYGVDRFFKAQGKPLLGKAFVNGLNTDGARLNAEIHPNQGSTRYHFEYGTDTSYGTVVPIADDAVSPGGVQTVGQLLQGLAPGTEYHYRVVATNLAGVSTGADHIFRTFPRVSSFVDECENALSRQQTGAALLPDCRSYELASARDTDGYDVESDLVPGQQPFDGPTADGRLLYGVHDGGVPGSGNPTNHGLDPYLATRSASGWTTKYVGIPANGTPSIAPFASTLLAADQDFEAFAFGGSELCDPCFADGTAGIPVRGSDGSLAQGMAGGQSPVVGAKPDGLIRAPLSADGRQLIFGSTSQFELDGNDETGDVSIYQRDLIAGTTQVVSKTPAGTNLPCLQGPGTCHSPGNSDGIAELAVSADGSRIVVAQKVATDSDGNVYWHPYMHIGSDPHTVDLAPGTTTGVLFDGMTADGSKVFFTSRDKLLPEDTDASADIYLNEVDGPGSGSLELVSVDGSGPHNADDCTPLGDWNTVSSGPNCDAVAFAGGAGVASEDGTFYFLSPELLDGANGVEDVVNMYVVRPGGRPDFVVTLDSDEGKPVPPPSRPVANSNRFPSAPFPTALAVDQHNGDVYVGEGEVIKRYKENGEPHVFEAGSGAGTNELYGVELWSPTESQIAVDNHAGSLFENDLYVTYNGITVFDESGEQLGSIEGVGRACGVTVDPSNGDVYVGNYFQGIKRLRPISHTLPIGLSDYQVTNIRTAHQPCNVAADGLGHVFGNHGPSAESEQTGPLRSYPTALFVPGPGPIVEGDLVAPLVNGVTFDPSAGELLVNVGSRIEIYGPLGDFRGEFGNGELAGSRAIGVNGANHHVFAVNGSPIVEFGYVIPPEEPINNPAVLHAVHQAGIRSTADFQVSPDGRFAAFNSSVPITSFDSFGHLEVYRYEAADDSIVCASCAPTNSQATRDALLPQHGNAMTSDGRVFFNSNEPLVLRDTNGNKDAYEWKDGMVYLISSGTSPFDSGMLSVSASGKDAYFFTREKMAPEDLNGAVMRIYDAREGGGFFHIPAPPQCKASDECHGPGSQAPGAAEVGSRSGTEGNLTKSRARRCRTGFVRKRGKCVRKKHVRRHHKGRGGR